MKHLFTRIGAITAIIGACLLSTIPTASATSWANVTPISCSTCTPAVVGIDAAGQTWSCGNYGTQTVVQDPDNPADLYVEANCQGIWESTDYGATWGTGPVNTGTNGTTAGDCAGGITLQTNGAGNAPTIFEACIRGAGTGLWKSGDGGVDWSNITPSNVPAGRDDLYPPVIDPYNRNYMLIAGHEENFLDQGFFTGGVWTWTQVTEDSGMIDPNDGTAYIFYLDTGSASTTKNTWLYVNQQYGPVGTWTTSNGGSSWTKTDTNEHPHGNDQIYQTAPCNAGGVIYSAGAYSTTWGVQRSADCGATWTQEGSTGNMSTVFGDANNIWAEDGGASSPPCASGSASFERAGSAGTAWTSFSVPFDCGAASAVVVTDGSGQNWIVSANWTDGIWRKAVT